MPLWLDVVSALTIAVLLVAAFGLARMAWRIVRGNEEMEAGGSLGDQLLGTRNRKDEPSGRSEGRER